MYPLKSGLWPSCSWYVAGFGDDLAEKPIERTILGQRILLFRTEGGEPVALAGLCPHRFMPLVAGERNGDVISCAYHGMAFASDGKCVQGPAGNAAVGRLRRYPVAQTGPLVWIWMGAPEDGDPGPLPDVALCGLADGWRADPNGMLPIQCRYTLIIDNLFDLSHIGWVHSSLLGAPPICAETPTIDHDRGLLHFERCHVSEVDPFSRFLFPDAVGPIENILATTMLAPGLITAVGPSVTEAEASPIAGQAWGEIHFVHAVTPETEHSTNIFTLVTRNFRLDDEALSQALRGQNVAVLAQDKAVAEAIEAALRVADTEAEMSFRSDRGGIEARRIIDRLIQAETSGHPAAA